MDCRGWYARRQSVRVAMDQVSQTRKAFRFGAYDLDLAGQELRKGGVRVRLQPKPFRILTILLETAGTTVSRDELKKLLWAPDTFVDFDHGLNSAINKIREALNDSADAPRFIETLPNGYRFIGALDSEQTVPTDPAVCLPESTAGGAGKIHWWRPHSGVIAVATACLLVTSLFAVRYQLAFFSQPKIKIESVAVLPLRNLSGDASQEYFSDSLTDELITQLAKISSLRVASSASVMRYKNTNSSVSEMSRDLKVDAFVEGSVIRSGDKVRITAQLIDAKTDRHIWAEDYNSEMRDILVLQNNIATSIASKVQAGIAPAGIRKQSPPHQVDPRAYDAYIKGRGHFFRRQPKDLEHSADEFRQAIQFDPNYAPAYAGLANSYGFLTGMGLFGRDEGWKLSEDMANKALALDPCSAEAHSALAAKALGYDWDWPAMEREIQLGLECDPRYAELYNLNSHYLAYMGRFDESIAAARRAQELDAVSQRHCLQRSLRLGRRFDLYLEELNNVFHTNPAAFHAGVAYVHKARKEYAQEVEETDQALRFEGCIACAERLAMAYARGGYHGWLEAKLAELKRRSGEEYVDPLEYAQIFAALGKADLTMKYLEAAFREHSFWLLRLQSDVAYDGLHSDPRYQGLVRQIGLPPSTASP